MLPIARRSARCTWKLSIDVKMISLGIPLVANFKSDSSLVQVEVSESIRLRIVVYETALAVS